MRSALSDRCPANPLPDRWPANSERRLVPYLGVKKSLDWTIHYGSIHSSPKSHPWTIAFIEEFSATYAVKWESWGHAINVWNVRIMTSVRSASNARPIRSTTCLPFVHPQHLNGRFENYKAVRVF